MKTHIRLGRFHGVSIGLHISWLIIAFLMTLSLVGRFHSQNPDWSDQTVWGTALITCLLFFLTIIIHELSHAMVAQSHGIPVRAITLFALGGVAQIEKESSDAKTEFEIGIVGPATSMGIGFFCLALARFKGWAPFITPSTPGMALLVWLGYINLGLAFFNLIPGFPLDGGRVFRSLVWWLTGNELRATRVSARIGGLVAFLFIFYGLWKFFFGWGLNGLWLAFIGLFLKDAARETSARMEWESVLKDLRVGDIMSRDCPTVAADTNLEIFVHDYLLKTGRHCFVVSENGRNLGLITTHEVKEFPRSDWPTTPVFKAMKPIEKLRAVSPDTSAFEAFVTMNNENATELPVVTDRQFGGLLLRNDFLRIIESRQDLIP